ncbi:MAG: hypothetical protein GYA33_04975 [Thermogutta sp.]|nr:hypothetical protein [Thermogutta sp.]
MFKLMAQPKGHRSGVWAAAAVAFLLWILGGCATTSQSGSGKVETVQDWMKLESPRP